MTDEDARRRRRARLGLIAGAALFILAFFWGTTGGGAAFAEQRPQVSVVNPGGTPPWSSKRLAQIATSEVQPGAALRSEFAVMNVGAAAARIDVHLIGDPELERYVHASIRDTDRGAALYNGPLRGAEVTAYDIGLGVRSQRTILVQLDIEPSAPESIRGAMIAPRIEVTARPAR